MIGQFFALTVALTLLTLSNFSSATGKPFQNPASKQTQTMTNQSHNALETQWTNQVSITYPWQEYPRPQMTRRQWQNLNGQWQFQSAGKDESPPFGQDLDQSILVPFPMESSLSGVNQYSERAWYRREFQVPKQWRKSQILLHFGAVDWQSVTYINGKKVGGHTGSYDSFSFDITSFLKPGEVNQEIIVGVYDPVSNANIVRGKQSLESKGIMYTSSSGIWQTVWIEPVPQAHIERIAAIPDLKTSTLSVQADCVGGTDLVTRAEAFRGSEKVAEAEGNSAKPVQLSIPRPHLWTPDDPFLYHLTIQLLEHGKRLDTVVSYFGMRSLALGHNDKGLPDMLLNGRTVFQLGVLDQGYWPDGIYLAPTDDALKSDIEEVKSLGMNLIRKHAKVEPDRWYYWADKLGILVWQDMPQAWEDKPTDEEKLQFKTELTNLINQHISHPCIVVWVPFNEGWGQHDTSEITDLVKHLDASRLVDSASGWTDFGTGDISDIHVYPGPKSPKQEQTRVSVLGEFGGLGLPIPGHIWSEGWGYKEFKTKEELTAEYVKLLSRVKDLQQNEGLCAAIYTQITDVEQELNGFYTYDRLIFKMDRKAVIAANKLLVRP